MSAIEIAPRELKWPQRKPANDPRRAHPRIADRLDGGKGGII
jgi:hypothetical protein